MIMPVYKYISVDTMGKEKKGVLEGDSRMQVRQLLRSQGLAPIEVTLSKERASKSSSSWFTFTRRISPTDLSLITYQFATLLGAGLPVEEALMNIAEQSEKQHVKSTLLGVHAKVMEGHSLAASFEEFPASFPVLYRSSVAAGEKSGQLSNVLNRLAEYMEKQQHVQQKVQQALVYPGLLTFISIGIVAFLLTYVVPRIVSIFSTSGQSLPTATIILLKISDLTQAYGIYVLIALIVGIIVFRQLLKQKHIRYGFHKFLLNTPILGKALRDLNTSRFARTFGILFAASVPVLEAMHAANSIVKLLPMQEAIGVAINKVREGMPINQALQQSKYFSLLTVRLIAAGEMSGQLEKMLEKSAGYQERMVEKKIDMGLAMFEPLMIIVMGAIVLFIVLAILLPIFEINQLVG